MTEENNNVIVLSGENGEEMEFEHLDTIELNEQQYVILLPLDDEEEVDEVIILKIEDDENGEEVLAAVEDEEELSDVFEEFKVRMADEFEFEDDDE